MAGSMPWPRTRKGRTGGLWRAAKAVDAGSDGLGGTRSNTGLVLRLACDFLVQPVPQLNRNLPSGVAGDRPGQAGVDHPGPAHEV